MVLKVKKRLFLLVGLIGFTLNASSQTAVSVQLVPQFYKGAEIMRLPLETPTITKLHVRSPSIVGRL